MGETCPSRSADSITEREERAEEVRAGRKAEVRGGETSRFVLWLSRRKDVVIPMIDIYNQQDFTFECWVYPFGVIPQQYNQIIITGRGEWGGDDPGAFQLGIKLVDDVPQARWFFRVAGAWETVTGGPEIEPEQWYHFAGTLEGGQKATLYVNGEEAATGNLAVKLADNPHPIYVGSWGAAEEILSAYHGYIDELRYSDEVLAPDKLGFGEVSVEPKGKLSVSWGEVKTRY